MAAKIEGLVKIKPDDNKDFVEYRTTDSDDGGLCIEGYEEKIIRMQSERIQVLERAIRDFVTAYKDVGNMTTSAKDGMRKQLVANLESVLTEDKEWISVEDRLPEEGQLIIARNQNGVEWFDCFYGEEPLGNMFEWKPNPSIGE